MRGFTAFLGKEFLEQTKTAKMLVLVVVMALLGLISPITAKMLPQLMEMLPTEGLNIDLQLPSPTVADSYVQFFSNVGQMGTILLLIVFSAAVTGELSKGTAPILFAKGLSRDAFLLAKFISSAVGWTVGYLLASGVCYGGTVFLFRETSIPGLLFSSVCMWLFGIFCLALLLFAGSVTKGSFAPMLLAGGVLAALLLANVVPQVADVSPIALAGQNAAIVAGSVAAGDLLAPLLVTLAATAALLVGAVLCFRRREL